MRLAKTPDVTQNRKQGITVPFLATTHRIENTIVLKWRWAYRAESLELHSGRAAGGSIMSATGLRTPTFSPPFVASDNNHDVDTGGLVEVHGSYRVRLASSDADRLAAFRLRYLVFNLELNEGLDTANATGYEPTISTRSVTTSSWNIYVQARLLGPTGSRRGR